VSARRVRAKTIASAAGARLAEGLAQAPFPARSAVALTEALAVLREQRAAAQQQPAAAARPERAPLRGRPWRVRVTRPLAVGIALVAVSGAATARSLWLAPAGNPVYGFNPRLASSAPPAAQLDALAVLRRAQTDADRGPGVAVALNDINNLTSGVRSDYVRVLERTAGGAAVLVPVERRDASGTGVTAQSAIADALCVYYPFSGPASRNNAAACWSTQQLLAGRAVAVIGGRAYGVVPDGVASVVITLGAQHESAAVSGNFFDVPAPAGAGSAVPTTAPVLPTISFSRSSG